MRFSRRQFLESSAALGLAPLSPTLAGAAAQTGGTQFFAPTWESLIAQYRAPEWFRDAKFGIWAHWSAQCVPEQGDWYARSMYMQGSPAVRPPCQTYGHPSKFGFMEIDHLWKAERLGPAGAH